MFWKYILMFNRQGLTRPALQKLDPPIMEGQFLAWGPFLDFIILCFFNKIIFFDQSACRMALKSEQLYLVFFRLPSLSPFWKLLCKLDCKTVDSYCMVIGSHLWSYCVKFWEVKLDWRSCKRTKQFSVFNPQDPQDPQVPRVPRASEAKPQEEEGFLGLVPLVTHPSSIPLLGGLTPKFLTLSFLSL
jgi:hypothetical protein